MKKIPRSIILLLAVVGLVLFLDGLSRLSNRELSGAAEEKIKTYSQPIAEELMLGIATNDFDQFSAQFGPNLLEAFGELQFTELLADLQPLGKYSALEFDSAYFESGYVVAYFNVTFMEGKAGMRLVLEPGRKHRIEGLAFRK